MTRPYDDIPRQGEHTAPRVEEEPSTNVRAQQPVMPSQRGESAVSYQLSYSRGEGLYKARRIRSAETAERKEGFEEIGRYGDVESFRSALGSLPEEARFVVSESESQSEISFDDEAEVSQIFAEDDDFDLVTIFSDPSKAEAYVNTRENEFAS